MYVIHSYDNVVALLLLTITIAIVIFDDKLVTMFYNKYDTVFWHDIVAIATFPVLVTMVII